METLCLESIKLAPQLFVAKSAGLLNCQPKFAVPSSICLDKNENPAVNQCFMIFDFFNENKM